MSRTKRWNQRIQEKYDRDRSQGKPVYILGIETSCDETSAAVIKDGKEILSNIVSSQIEIHRRFGGVVPEVASRHHVENITLILEESLREAGIDLSDISAVAVTYGPGLVGALLIGVAAAKAICFTRDIPLIGVHHIAGHIYANQLVAEMQFPLLALVVSGGHTELVLMNGHDDYQILGKTRDDAVGEAYDKVARALDLPYPGGPYIDQLAQKGKEEIDLPRAWLEPDSYDFSFSGLMWAVLNVLHNSRQRGELLKNEDVAASFQASVIEVLVEKTIRAARQYQVKQIIVAGGVAANQGLRQVIRERAEKEGFSLVIPPLSLCTDNAAMIAAAGHILYEKGEFAEMDLNGVPGLPLSKKGNPKN